MALPPKSDLPGASPAQAGENLGIEAFHAVDRIREALSAQLSGGISPGSLMLAWSASVGASHVFRDGPRGRPGHHAFARGPPFRR